MKYTAIINTPGYLPWSDEEPPIFDIAELENKLERDGGETRA